VTMSLFQRILEGLLGSQLFWPPPSLSPALSPTTPPLRAAYGPNLGRNEQAASAQREKW
jgi:hypothetical protein